VNIVLERLRKAGLTVKPQKVVFATKQISFLEYMVSQSGMKIDPERMKVISQFPAPRDAKSISRFIRMVNYYQKFIHHLADIAAPLNALRKKGAQFVWGREQQAAFERLKKAISQPPVLAMDDIGKKVHLANQCQWGCVGGGTVPGKLCFSAAHNICIPHLDQPRAQIFFHLRVGMCRGTFGTVKFRKYVEHQEFVLETDNQALSWLLVHPRQLGKIGRWKAKKTAIKFEVRHDRGTQNIVADALSRMFEIPPLEGAVQEQCSVILTE
jgi:hypothetical protein